MIYRIVRLQFHPEFCDDFMAIFTERKEKVVGFKGCLSMKLLQDQVDPSVYFTFSVWEHEDCLEAYRESDVFISLWRTIKPWFSAKAQAWTTVLLFEGAHVPQWQDGAAPNKEKS